MKTVHKLPLVLVNPFHLHVKNGAHIHVNAILFLDKICKPDLVLLQVYMVTLVSSFNSWVEEQLLNERIYEWLTNERANKSLRWGAIARNVSFKTLSNGRFAVSTPLIKLNYLAINPTNAAPKLVLKTYPLYSNQRMEGRTVNQTK